MSFVAKEIHRDDSPLFTGTHDGASSSSFLRDDGANFNALGVVAGLYVDNETQSTSGAVTAADRDTVTVSGVTWDYGDTYSIYKTTSKNSHISSVWTDVSAGWKVTEPHELNRDGWRPEDADIDDHGRRRVFGPNQPE